jgi:hypothetical protein
LCQKFKNKVNEVIKRQKDLKELEKANEIQIKAASTITRKTAEAVGREWSKCKAAIENNFT